MPSLPARELAVTGIRFGAARAFYAPIGEHELVDCPDCGQHADPTLGGDHGGQCIADAAVALPKSALGIIRRYALSHRKFSSNQLRAAFDDANIPGPPRGPAFAAAERREWVEHDGYEPSTDPGTKRHDVKVWRSLIFQPPKEKP